MIKQLRILLAVCITATIFTTSVQAQIMTYSEVFTNGATYCPGNSQYDNWGTFRASLDTNTRTFLECTIRGSLNSVGVTCADPALVKQMAGALKNGVEMSFTCNGRIWTVGNSCITGCAISGDDIEFNASNTGADCSCGSEYTIRPCIGNANWGGISNTSCGAPTQTMEVEFNALPPIPLDGGVIAINTPKLPTCELDTNLMVTIKQFGFDTINTIDVGWSVNGVTQPLTNWTGSLKQDETDDSLFLGSYPFAPGDTLIAWTNNPNSVLDSNDFNDTIKVIIPGLSISGTYTIDTNFVTGGTNFHSFADAIQMIDSVGICDTLILNVTAGVYTEQISIPEIVGASINSPVIIRGNQTDSTRLDFEALNSSLNYTLQLDGADWFIFENMYFSASGTNYSRTVEFTGGADNNKMKNCVFLGDSLTTTTSTNAANVFASNTTNNKNSFTNCSFIGGSYGVYWIGENTTNLNENSVFDSCQFLEWYYMGAHFYYNNNLIVSNSRFLTNSSYTGTTYGIYNYYSDGAHEITNNRIEHDTTAVPNYGIYLNNSDATNSSPGLIANNAIVIGDSVSTSTLYGIRSDNNSFQNIYHNSITTVGGNTSSRTIHFSGGGANRSANNNIVNLGNGHAYYLATPFALLSSENNNIYVDSADIGYFGTNQSTLSDWQTNSGFDSKSVSVDPNFKDLLNNDFHVCNDTLNNAGQDLLGMVNYDFDGQMRNQSNPDIGADEFTGLSDYLFSQDTIVICPGGDVVLTGATDGPSNSWSTGATTPSITVSTSGTWTLTVTNSCGVITDSVVTIISGPMANTNLDNAVSCNGLSDGEVSVTGSGGTMPYAYNWSNLSTTASISGLTPGNYLVTLTDSNGCNTIDSVMVTEPTSLVSTATVSNDPTCYGSTDGEVTVISTGGTTPYGYLWSNASTTNMVAGLAAGSYSVTVTDANGCSSATAVAIANPAVLVNFTSVDSNVSCYGMADGGATITATGGASPYNYLWSNSATTATSTGLTAGQYMMTITDGNGCTSLDSVTITEPVTLNGSVTLNNNVSCNNGNDGSATATAIGGTMPYSYSWSNGISIALNNTLTATSNTVTVTDANGCSSIGTVTITEPTLLTNSVSQTDVTCMGGTNGTAAFATSGGTTPYNYTWSNAGINGSSSNSLSSGAYTVTITDLNGCSLIENLTIGSGNVLPIINLGADTSFCANDTISLAAGSGFSSYQWSSGDTTASISTSFPAFYWVEVSDSDGCSSRDTILLSNHPSFAVGATGIDVLCKSDSNGSASASVAGGTAPFTYLWDDAANQTTATANNLVENTYTVLVTDANNCSNMAVAVIDYSNPTPTIGLIEIDTICDTYTYMIAPPAGFAHYLWSNGDTTSTLEVDTAGVYSLTVTDVNGCTNSDTITLMSSPCLGIESITGNVQVNYYPNPTSGIVNMELIGMQGKNISLSVLNLQGQVILQEKINNLGEEFQKQLNLSQHAKGVYIIRVISDNKQLVNRITVQ